MRTLIIVLRSALVYQLLVPIKGLRFHESYSQLFSVQNDILESQLTSQLFVQH